MFKAVDNLRNQKAFTLIELLIVVAIIGILAAIAIPAYIGAQEKARKSNLEKAAKSAEPDLMHWMNSAIMATVAGSPGALRIDVDTNWDGIVTPLDCTNAALLGALTASASVAADYAAARSNVLPTCGSAAAHYGGAGEASPWAGFTSCIAGTFMFVTAPDPGAATVGLTCQVQLSPVGANTIRVIGSDNGPGGGGAAPQLLSTIVVAAE